MTEVRAISINAAAIQIIREQGMNTDHIPAFTFWSGVVMVLLGLFTTCYNTRIVQFYVTAINRAYTTISRKLSE